MYYSRSEYPVYSLTHCSNSGDELIFDTLTLASHCHHYVPRMAPCCPEAEVEIEVTDPGSPRRMPPATPILYPSQRLTSAWDPLARSVGAQSVKSSKPCSCFDFRLLFTFLQS